MLGDEGLSRWTKFKMEDTDSEDPNKVYKKFRDSLGNDVSYRTARATLYNNFRQKKDLPSPFEILRGRTGRTIAGKQEEKLIDNTQIRNALIERQTKTTEHYNRRHGVKHLSPLQENDNVLIQHKDGNWEPATIKQVGPEPRSYLCATLARKVFRRNRKHIQPTGMPNTSTNEQRKLQTPRKCVQWSNRVEII